MDNDYVIIPRSIVNRSWYKDYHRIWLHLILTANFESDGEIKRGQRVANYQTLSNELKLPIQTIKAAIKRLTAEGEVTYIGNNKHGVITMNNYGDYRN